MHKATFRGSTTTSGNDPNTSIAPANEIRDDAAKVHENLKHDPSVARKLAFNDDMRVQA